MSLVSLLFRESPSAFVACVALSAINSIVTLLFVSTVTRGYDPNGVFWGGWLVPVALVAAVAVTLVATPVVTAQISRRAIERVRRKFLVSIMSAPMEKLERAGQGAILSSLVEDGMKLTMALPATVMLVRDATFFALCSFILAWISPAVATATFAFMLIVVGVNVALRSKSIKYERGAMAVRERLVGLFRNTIDGAKEVKSSTDLREAILERAENAELDIRRVMRRANFFSSVGEALTMVFLLVALLAVSLGDQSSTGSRATYVAVLVMMMMPIRGISAMLQTLAQGRLALERVGKLTAFLSPVQMSEVVNEYPVFGAIERLSFSDVVYRYPSTGESGYELGPISCQLESGQVLFVVGGNGSGKTTFVKMLTGLYKPSAGSISLNDKVIDDRNREWYARNFSTVYYDFCLFESLAGTQFEEDIANSDRLISLARLKDVLRAHESLLSQAKRLSAGQQRRVALLLSLVRDRAVCVFDEFAADQDPSVKAFFYEELLPALRAQGKLVIVITHDSRYFECCDAVLNFERGQRPVFKRKGERAHQRPAEVI